MDTTLEEQKANQGWNYPVMVLILVLMDTTLEDRSVANELIDLISS